MAHREMMTDLEVANAGGMTSGALLQLGIMYSLGQDVERDLVAAHKWFNLAAARGDRCAKQYRRDISVEMSQAEIARAQREAREWRADDGAKTKPDPVDGSFPGKPVGVEKKGIEPLERRNENMTASKTALAAAALGVIAAVSPVETGKKKYNFTFEVPGQEVVAASRNGEGRREGLIGGAPPIRATQPNN